MKNHQSENSTTTSMPRESIISWLILILLTFLSVFLGLFVEHRAVFVITALMIVVWKGQQIVDVFMELKHAPRKWRFLLLSYMVLIPVIITFIYLI